MRPTRLQQLTCALLAFGLLFAACGGDDDDASEEPAPTEAPAEAEEPAEADEPTETDDEATDAQEPTETEEPAETDDEATGNEEAATAGERDFAAVAPIVEAFVADNELNGAGLIIVDRDEGVVHEEYWGEFGPDRISLVASSSKMITAGVLLRLADDGLLDIDAPAGEQAGWPEADPSITTAQLLSNSSGLVGLLDDPTYAPYICQYLAAGTLTDCGKTILSTPADDADVVEPDTKFRYGGGQWQVAGAVAEAVSGKSWAELINEIYVEPCGLETLGYNNHFTQIGASGFEYPDEFDSDPSVLEATDNPNMEGGAYVTTGDYAKLLMMHLNNGMCGDTPVLSPEALAVMHSDRIGEVYNGDAFAPGSGYGMGWWLDRETGRLTDGGAYGSVPWLDLEDGYGAYLVIEESSQLGGQLSEQLFDVVEAAMVS